MSYSPTAAKGVGVGREGHRRRSVPVEKEEQGIHSSFDKRSEPLSQFFSAEFQQRLMSDLTTTLAFAVRPSQVQKLANGKQRIADMYGMNLENHPSCESMEAHLNAASVRLERSAAYPQLSSIIEDHLLVCGTCQEMAEEELALASLIRRSLVANDPSLCRTGESRIH